MAAAPTTSNRAKAVDDHGLPFAPRSGVLRPLGLDDVKVESGFLADLQSLNAAAMIDHCAMWVERAGWVNNFDAAVEGRLPRDRKGREFSDSDVYKLMEAMAWEIGRTGDAHLEELFRSYTARIAPVQEPDGYLNTMFGRPQQKPRYSDLQWGHELYCFGHLIQAGVARARTTEADDDFVRIAVRAADHVCEAFGPDGNPGVCGHPEIEVALVELHRLTGEQRYINQARSFVERRGHGVLGDIEFGAQYFQDHQPVREQVVFDGHAVRALYLAAGAADLAIEDKDDELLAAVSRQTLTTLARRTYLTGGMGAHHEGESFGADYELPSDRAYSETCAGVASVMLNHRLLLATGEVRHADAVERTLYNVVATSPAEDGRAFHYTNTLHQRTPGEAADPEHASPRAASSLRAPWFHVSCCPTNVARTVASLAAYVASTDDSGVQLHQYAGATVQAHLPQGDVVLRVATDYPRDGVVRVEVVEAPSAPWTLSMRVPGWAEGATLAVAGRPTEAVAPGYARVQWTPTAGEIAVLSLPMAPRWTWPDPRVDAVRGQVAVELGPLVLCLESVDFGNDVAMVRVRTDEPPREEGGRVLVPTRAVELADTDWPYAAEPDAGALLRSAEQERFVPLVPYQSWANRGPSTMRVWMPTA